MDDLYPYQHRVLEALMQGKNVILVVPTGGGKTLAATMPYFHHLAWRESMGIEPNVQLLPGKALYVSPMRVLATQFVQTCKELYGQLEPEYFQKIEQRFQHVDRELLSIQTGESPHDPQFESLVTACTIDQLLSSGLGVPYSLDKRRSNVNVGAVCCSYLILDEPHLYPMAEDGKSYKGGLTTCLELLRLMKGLTRFVFMSATMSSELVKRLSVMLDAVVITVEDAELKELNKERVRRVERAANVMSAEQILSQHEQATLVVCNTVQRAQEMYMQLDALLDQSESPIELKLLHSRFEDGDRARLAKELGELLGKEQWKKGSYVGSKSVIVVATQVVEVGLDISVQTLHTELAPANSLIQRTGRCARFEKQHGRVIVYYPECDEEGKPLSSAPYNAELCEETWQALAAYDGEVMGFLEEQALVDLVHTKADLDVLERYEQHRYELQKAITTGLKTGESGDVSELIREVRQIQLIIHNDPDETIKEEPWRYRSFGIRPTMLQGKHWARLCGKQNEVDSEWLMKQAVVIDESKAMQEEDERKKPQYKWDPIQNPAQVSSALLLAMPNKLVTYDPELGLVFLDGRLILPEKWRQRLQATQYQSLLRERKQKHHSEGKPTKTQTYAQHIGGVADAYYYALRHDMAYVMSALDRCLELPVGMTQQAVQLAIVFHDLGKLADGWQRWTRVWLRTYAEKTGWPYSERPATEFLAKTTYDYRSQEQKQWQRDMEAKRPHHACESVMIGRPAIAASLCITSSEHPLHRVLRAICFAIAHHHTPNAHEYGATKVSKLGLEAVKEALVTVQRGGNWTCDVERLKLEFEKGDLQPDGIKKNFLTYPEVSASQQELYETWLAFVLVRMLRLADQRADVYAVVDL